MKGISEPLAKSLQLDPRLLIPRNKNRNPPKKGSVLENGRVSGHKSLQRTYTAFVDTKTRGKSRKKQP